MFKTLKTRRRLKKLERMLHVNLLHAFQKFEECLNDDEIDHVDKFIDECNAGFERHVTFKVEDQDVLRIIYDNGGDICLRNTGPDNKTMLSNSTFTDKDAIYRIRHWARLSDIFEAVFMEALWTDLCHSTTEDYKQNKN